jgi:hypothetical protein
MSDERTDLFDAYIDAVACDMTAVRPHVNITARVLRRIEQAGQPHPIRISWRLPLAAAVVVTVVLAVAIGVHVRRAAPVFSRVGKHPVYTDANPSRVQKDPAYTTDTTRLPRREYARVDTASQTTEGVPIEQLQIDSIAVSPLAEMSADVPHTSPPPPISVTPLVMTPLTAEGER